MLLVSFSCVRLKGALHFAENPPRQARSWTRPKGRRRGGVLWTNGRVSEFTVGLTLRRDNHTAPTAAAGRRAGWKRLDRRATTPEASRAIVLQLCG